MSEQRVLKNLNNLAEHNDWAQRLAQIKSRELLEPKPRKLRTLETGVRFRR